MTDTTSGRKIEGEGVRFCGLMIRTMRQKQTNDIDFENKVRCVGGMTAVPGTTDYDTIAERYAAMIDERSWNALYERPTTLALLRKSASQVAPA